MLAEADTYILTTRSYANGDVIGETSTTSTTSKVTGLEPDTSYVMTVEAYSNDNVLTGRSEVIITTGKFLMCLVASFARLE